MNQSVIKALSLLNYFSEETKELTLNELSNKADIPKPTAYRLIFSLEACGFLRKSKHSEHDVRYTLGLKLMELGHIVQEQLELRKISYPHMEHLSKEINEVVHLVVLDGEQAVYIEKVESQRAVRLYTRVGKRSPLYVGSGPKLLFAYLDEEKQNMILHSMVFEQLTSNTISNKEDIKNEAAEILKAGYSISKGEQDSETIGISYPVRDYTGKVIAALGVSGPTNRIVDEGFQLVKEKTQYFANKISKDLGYEFNNS